MKPNEIRSLIARLKKSPDEYIILEIEGKFPVIQKTKIIDLLSDRLETVLLKEFNYWLKNKNVLQYKIAEKLGIKSVTFTQMLKGDIRSNKKTGRTIEFINKSKVIAETLCSQ